MCNLPFADPEYRLEFGRSGADGEHGLGVAKDCVLTLAGAEVADHTRIVRSEEPEKSLPVHPAKQAVNQHSLPWAKWTCFDSLKCPRISCMCN